MMKQHHFSQKISNITGINHGLTEISLEIEKLSFERQEFFDRLADVWNTIKFHLSLLVWYF